MVASVEEALSSSGPGRRRTGSAAQAVAAFAAVLKRHGPRRFFAGGDEHVCLEGCAPLPFGDLRALTASGWVVVEVEGARGVSNLVKYWCAMEEGAIEGRVTLIHVFPRSARGRHSAQLRLWRFVASQMRARLGDRFRAHPFSYGPELEGLEEATELFERLLKPARARSRRPAPARQDEAAGPELPAAAQAPEPRPPAPSVESSPASVRPERLELVLKRLIEANAGFMRAALGVPATLRTQPGACGEWSVKDAVALLAAWDRELVRRLGELAAGVDREPSQDAAAFSAGAVRRRAAAGWDQVLAELAGAFAALRRALGALPPALRTDPRVVEAVGSRASDYAQRRDQVSVAR